MGTMASKKAKEKRSKKGKKEKEKEEEKEVPLQLPIGVQLPLQPILAACSSLQDVGKWACVSRETRDLVETSDTIWRETAKRMDACGMRVNQGFADKAFLLSAKNLENTNREVVHTRQYFRSYDTYKFSPVDIVELALKKHGGAAGITRARKKRTARKRKFEENRPQREEKKRKREEEKREKQRKLEKERRSELEAAFRDLDPTLDIRCDSKLCSQFIRSGNGNPDEIARIMFQMRWFHSTEEYEEASQSAFEETRSIQDFLWEDEFEWTLRQNMEGAKRRVVRKYIESGREHEVPSIVLQAYR